MSRETKLLDIYEDYRSDPAFAHLRSYTSGIRLVPGEGTVTPIVLVIGEAPGATENTHVRPFVGAAGKVLRAMMAQVGLSLDNTFITNVVKYRPPGNRKPTNREIEASRPYIRREWRTIGRPPIILTAGATALFAILDRPSAMGKTAGSPQLLRDERTWLYPMFHPSYVLHNERFRPEYIKQWNNFFHWLEEFRG